MNRTSKSTHRSGFTLIEVVIVIAAAGIITVGIGVLLANGQKCWGQLVTRVYGDSAIDGFAAQAAFDRVCRKASLRKYVLGESAESLELYYWDSSSTASTPENYAQFYQSGNQMFVDYGKTQTGAWQPDTSEPTATVALAGDVQSLTFAVEGTSVQMFLTYTDSNSMPVVYSSVRHND